MVAAALAAQYRTRARRLSTDASPAVRQAWAAAQPHAVSRAAAAATSSPAPPAPSTSLLARTPGRRMPTPLAAALTIDSSTVMLASRPARDELSDSATGARSSARATTTLSDAVSEMRCTSEAGWASGRSANAQRARAAASAWGGGSGMVSCRSS